MATWQFDCVLIPRAGHPAAARAAAHLLRDGSERLWNGHPVATLMSELEVLGKPQPTWAPDTVMWGHEDSTCLLLAASGDATEELRLRIDMRHPDDALLRNVLRCCRTLDLLVVTHEGDVVEPRLEWLMRSAATSPAGRFVADPEQFLAALASAPTEVDDND